MFSKSIVWSRIGVAVLCTLSVASAAHLWQQQQTVHMLQAQNQQLETMLAEQQSRLRRSQEFAQVQALEVREELARSRSQMEELWSMVTPRRRPALSSRSGRLPNQRYQELLPQLSRYREDMLHLRRDARSYSQHHIPNGSPCAGEMTSGYGHRQHPVYGGGRMHNGCDFTTDFGTPIQATADGVVVRADWFGGFGKVVEVEHRCGLVTLYAHCDELVVKKGQRVVRGQHIANVGMTGLTSGPHCHYEVHEAGKPIDPQPYLGEGVRLAGREHTTVQ